MKIFLSVLSLSLASSAFAIDDSAVHYYNKGMAEKEAKRFLTSHQYFTKAIGFDGNYTEAYREDAKVALQMRKTDIALRQFETVLKQKPNDADAISHLTELYFNYRQYGKAVEFARKCASCENRDRIIGMSLYEQEDYAQALTYLKAAIAKNPADAVATYTIARTYLDAQDYKNAVPFYNKAVDLDPSHNNWIYELGLLQYNLNDFKNAAVNFEKAKENGYVTSNDFKENYAFALIYSGQIDKGEALINDVITKKMGNKDLIRSVATTMYEQKQYDRSLIYCQRLLEADAKDGKALYQAGLNFIKKGDKAKGQGMCDKAIELDPSLTSMRSKKDNMGMGM